MKKKKNKDVDGLKSESLLNIIDSINIPKKIRKLAQRKYDKLNNNE